MAAAVLELRERAARDPLTGLGHHATFHAALPAARGRRCVVLIADVDGFKAINDTRGHAAGDDVLRAMAGLLRERPPGRPRVPDRRRRVRRLFDADGASAAEQHRLAAARARRRAARPDGVRRGRRGRRGRDG